jgi:hypothetical protein
MPTCSGLPKKVLLRPDHAPPNRVQCPQFQLQAPIPELHFKSFPVRRAAYTAGNQMLMRTSPTFPRIAVGQDNRSGDSLVEAAITRRPFPPLSSTISDSVHSQPKCTPKTWAGDNDEA